MRTVLKSLLWGALAFVVPVAAGVRPSTAVWFAGFVAVSTLISEPTPYTREDLRKHGYAPNWVNSSVFATVAVGLLVGAMYLLTDGAMNAETVRFLALAWFACFGFGMLCSMSDRVPRETISVEKYLARVGGATGLGRAPGSGGRSIPQAVKIEVSVRDGGVCRRCGSAEDLQYDHVTPYSLGGSSEDPDNIQLLCGGCNRAKGNRYVG